MTPSIFVDALKSEVRDAAAEGLVAQLKKPSGRHPSGTSRRLSDWFNQLSENDQQVVSEIIGLATHSAVFRFLCVLDGVRVIDDGETQSKFRLEYVRPGQQTVVLNSSSENFLHDMLNAP